MFAYRFPFVAFPRKKGLFFWGRTPTSGRGRIVVQAWNGKRWRKLATARAGAGGVFKGIAKSHYGRNRKGTVRATFEGGSSVPFSMRPVPDFRQPPFG